MSLAVAKRCPLRSSSRAQRAIVVDLAVLEGEHVPAARAQRLVAGREVDDGEPAHAHRDARLDVHPLAVRPAMADRGEHRAQDVRAGRVRRVDDAGDAAHGNYREREWASGVIEPTIS